MSDLDQSVQNFGTTLVEEFQEIRRGEGMSGTFPIGVTGNAGTADKLKTPRNINGVSFDGSADIYISSLYGSDGNKIIAGNPVAGAVNQLIVSNAIAGSRVVVGTAGSDTDISMTVTAKGNGQVDLNAAGGVNLLPGSAGLKLYANDGSHRWTFNVGNLVNNRSLNFPLNGDVTLVAGTMVSTTENQSLIGVNTFSQPIIVTNTFNVNGSAPAQQRNGLYLADLGTTVGTTQNPINTAAIAAQISSSRSIALSVDSSGYLWGYRSDSSAGTYTFQSKAKQADKLTTARTVSVAGDATASGTFDGSADMALALTLSNTGVTAGNYNGSATQVTPFSVDSKGRITSVGTPVLLTPDWNVIQNKPTTLAGYGITDGLTAGGDWMVSGLWRFTNTTDTTSGSTGAAIFSGGVAIAKNLRVGGDVTINGNLVVHGSTFTVNSTVTTLDDPILTLGGDTDPTVDDAKDRGIEYRWHNGTSAKRGFFGFDRSDGTFTFIPDATNVNEVISGAVGTLKANLQGSVTGNADTATKLATPRGIAMTGDGTWNVTFDGSAPVTAALTLANSGVTAGTYNNTNWSHVPFTVDSKGRITNVGAPIQITVDFQAAVTNRPTTLAGYGITDAVDRTTSQTVGGIKTFTDSTDASSTTVAGTVVQGGLAVAKKAVVGTSMSIGSSTYYGNAALNVVAGDSTAGALFTRASNDTGSAYLTFLKTRGLTPNAVTSVAVGDYLGTIYFQGTDGTSGQIGAAIRSKVSTVGASVFGSDISLQTTTTGQNGLTDRLTVLAAGNVDIGMSGSPTSGISQLTVANHQSIVRAGTVASFAFRTSRGSLPAPTQTKLGDSIGILQAQSYTDTNTWVQSAQIQFQATEDQTATASGGQILFRVVKNGTTTLTPAMMLTNNGTVVTNAYSGQSTVSNGQSINAKLQNIGISQDESSFSAIQYNPNTTGPSIVLAKSRAGVGAFAALQSLDSLGQISWNGSDSTGLRETAMLQAYVDGAPAEGQIGTAVRLMATPTGGSAMTERMTFRANGWTGFNQSNPQTAFHFVTSGVTQSAAHPYRAGMVVEAEGNSPGGRIGIKTSNDTSETPYLLYYRSRGTTAAPTAVKQGDALGSMAYSAHDGVGWVGGGTIAYMGVTAAEDWSSTAHSTFMTFGAVLKGATSAVELMRLDEYGCLLVNTASNPVSDFYNSRPTVHITSAYDLAARISRNTSALGSGAGGLAFAGLQADGTVKDLGAIRGLIGAQYSAYGSVQIFARLKTGSMGEVAKFDHNANTVLGALAGVFPTDGYGRQLAVTQGALRSTILQQSVDTNDERVYLVNNLSPTPGGAFTGGFVYDKTGASATYYMQRQGRHAFAVAGVGTKDQAAALSEVVVIDSTGTYMTTPLQITVGAPNAMIANFKTTTTQLTIDGVGSPNSYIQGSVANDSVVRAEIGNLAIGALNGATVIGTATTQTATFAANGKVGIGTTVMRGQFNVGGGSTLFVGNGNDVGDTSKGMWVVKNDTEYVGFAWQLSAGGNAEAHVGNGSNNWKRVMSIQPDGVLIGGVSGATGVGDLSVKQVGSNNSASLNLSGASNGTYILMGNQDSGGGAGPAMIFSANRTIQLGVGTSYTTRTGGTFTPILHVDPSGCVGVQTTQPQNYGVFAAAITGASGLTQVGAFMTSPSSVPIGGYGGGLSLLWGGALRLGMRIMHGGDFNNAGLMFETGVGASSKTAMRLNPSGWMALGTPESTGAGSTANGSNAFPYQFTVSDNGNANFEIGVGAAGYGANKVILQAYNRNAGTYCQVDNYGLSYNWITASTSANAPAMTLSGTSLGVGTTPGVAPSARISAGVGIGKKVLAYDAGSGGAQYGLGADMFNGSSNQFSIFSGSSGTSTTNIAIGRIDTTSGTATEYARWTYTPGFNAGQLGIGTTSTWNGSSSRVSLNYQGSTQEYGMTLRTAYTSGSSTAINFAVGGGDNGTGTLTISGSITVNGSQTFYNSGSDVRIKTNITPLGEVGSVIDAIEVDEFEYVSTPGVRVQGFIAQKLYKTYKNAVLAGDDGTDPSDIKQTWMVDQSKMVPITIRELQSLRKRAATNEEKVRQLESRADLAERECNELKQKFADLELLVNKLISNSGQST